MHRVQTAQLFNDQKQKEYYREVGDKKILPFLWWPQASQGNEVDLFRRLKGKASSSNG
jgi:hypothetical protein